MRKRVAGTQGTVGGADLWIAVEGPLRAGKTTLAALLAARLSTAPVTEPEDNPFLAEFYAGAAGSAFSAQMWFLRRRLAALEQVQRARGPVVTDFMLEKDKLYAHLNLSDADLAVYREFYAAHAPKRRPDLVVYLQARPAVLEQRRRRKAVLFEQGVGEAYTTHVVEAYEHFFERYQASRLLLVDTSAIDFVHSEAERAMLLDRILAPVHGREHFAPLGRIA